jgi:hypothetical protein
VATIRSVMRFGGRAARCSALVLTLAALLGLPSPGGAKPVMSEAQCIVQDVQCTDKCDSKGVFEKLCYAICDAKLKACRDQVPSGPPDVRVGGNKAPVSTRFPDGRPASGVPCGPTRGDGRKVACGTTTGLGSTTNLGGTATGTRGGTATGANRGGGVMSGSTMSGATMPPGTSGGPGSVTAVTSNPTLNPTLPSTGGAFGSTKTGLGAGPIAGGIINGRKP